MKSIILLTQKDKDPIIVESPNSLIDNRAMVETYQKQGWHKVLSEYVAESQTHITILSKKE